MYVPRHAYTQKPPPLRVPLPPPPKSQRRQTTFLRFCLQYFLSLLFIPFAGHFGRSRRRSFAKLYELGACPYPLTRVCNDPMNVITTPSISCLVGQIRIQRQITLIAEKLSRVLWEVRNALLLLKKSSAIDFGVGINSPSGAVIRRELAILQRGAGGAGGAGGGGRKIKATLFRMMAHLSHSLSAIEEGNEGEIKRRPGPGGDIIAVVTIKVLHEQFDRLLRLSTRTIQKVANSSAIWEDCECRMVASKLGQIEINLDEFLFWIGSVFYLQDEEEDYQNDRPAQQDEKEPAAAGVNDLVTAISNLSTVLWRKERGISVRAVSEAGGSDDYDDDDDDDDVNDLTELLSAKRELIVAFDQYISAAEKQRQRAGEACEVGGEDSDSSLRNKGESSIEVKEFVADSEIAGDSSSEADIVAPTGKNRPPCAAQNDDGKNVTKVYIGKSNRGTIEKERRRRKKLQLQLQLQSRSTITADDYYHRKQSSSDDTFLSELRKRLRVEARAKRELVIVQEDLQLDNTALVDREEQEKGFAEEEPLDVEDFTQEKSFQLRKVNEQLKEIMQGLGTQIESEIVKVQ